MPALFPLVSVLTPGAVVSLYRRRWTPMTALLAEDVPTEDGLLRHVFSCSTVELELLRSGRPPRAQWVRSSTHRQLLLAFCNFSRRLGVVET